MTDFFNKLKIPTIFGLSIIVIGIAVGVFLTLREQIFISQATPNATAENITISNISDNEAVVSWQTAIPTLSFLTYGTKNPTEITQLNDSDVMLEKPTPRLFHYVTIKNLLPSTIYQFKVISGQSASKTQEFKTATPVDSRSNSKPVIGTLSGKGTPATEGIIYLSIADAIIQSTVIKQSGNFLIPTSNIKSADLTSNIEISESTIGKLSIISSGKQTNVVFKFKNTDQPLPPIRIGEDLDLTDKTSLNSKNSVIDLDKYDLNNDGIINSADNSIILQNQGKNPKYKAADINMDGIVDKKDSDLMSQKITDKSAQ